ncbi:MAG: hypothetical protein BGO01_18815 [Armatimonadetes bacterium 55-13]|nr:MAG: hypothetical protein BGO01_18815 [Armatimonadetes bacterium 55-13]
MEPLVGSGLTIQLLGPMHVQVGGKALPPLRSRKAYWLLALMTLRANRPVQRVWLASMLWPDAEQGKALANLRTVMSELRKALGEEKERLHPGDHQTVYLNLEGAHVDLREFDKAIQNGTSEDLLKAVGLYTGALLEGCSEEWAIPERDARERECLNALQRLGDAALQAGDPRGSLTWYARASAMDPWSDAARRGMMEALAQDGDVNEALQVYRSYADLLRGEANAVPDERTTALYQRLRSKARKPVNGEPIAQVAVVGIQEGYLPVPITELVGREDERDEVVTLLRRSRLVTLLGVGGIGKTRLAIAIGSRARDEFTDGVWFVPLDTTTEGSQIPVRVAGAMGLMESNHDGWLNTVEGHVRDKRLLIILDNCEHLLDTCATVVTRLLAASRGIRILTTSREAVGIPGEAVWAVPSLAAPDPRQLPDGATTLQRVLSSYEAIQLFEERAREANRGFALASANAREVAEICFRLEGVPLAIELAATRVRSMTVGQILERLNDHMGLLTTRSSGSRQTALSSTLNWSYELLSEAEQTLFRRLSLFVGGWTAEAARQVGGDDGQGADEIADLLASLVEKSLVVLRETRQGVRYRYLEMVRQFAAAKLEAFAERELIESRFLRWCGELTEELERGIGRPDQGLCFERIEADLDNFCFAMEGGSQTPENIDECLRIAGNLWLFWNRKGQLTRGKRYIDLVLERDIERRPTSHRAKALYGSGNLIGSADDPQARTQLSEESLEIYRELGDSAGIVGCLRSLGNAAFLGDDFPSARHHFSEALRVSREISDTRGIAHAAGSLALVAEELCELEFAESLWEEAVELARTSGEMNILAWGLQHLGRNRQDREEYAAAKACYEEALTVSQSVEFNAVTVSSLDGLALIADAQGDYSLAREYVAESLRISGRIGDLHGTSIWLRTLGSVAFHEGDLDSAETSFTESLELVRKHGGRRDLALTLSDLGRLELVRGKVELARSRFEESLDLCRQTNFTRGIAMGLDNLGALSMREGEAAWAVTLWACASGLREGKLLPLPTRERQRNEQEIGEARAALGSEAFEQAWEAGVGMDPMEALTPLRSV